jgi:hypothetical protein
VTGMSTTTAGGGTVDSSSDDIILDKLNRHEALLPGRRVVTQQSPSSTSNGHKLSREKSSYQFDEQVLLRTNTGASNMTAGLTQEALNELVPASRLASRKLYHDIVLRKPSAVGSAGDPTDDHAGTRRIISSNNLAPIKPSLTAQRGNILILQQQQKMKPRSLPSSTLDHANQHGFHLPNDPYGSRQSKNPSRTSHIDHPKKSQQNSPVRYNPGKLLFSSHLLNSTLYYPRIVSISSNIFRLNLDETNQVLFLFWFAVY